MKEISAIFNQLINNENLEYKKALFLFEKIINEELNPIQTASLLTLLKIKNESFEEISAAVDVLYKKAKKIDLSTDLIDTCGTGGDNKNSFNISTATSILCAACGLKVAKHGNKSITSKSGSSDILDSLRINIRLTDKEQKQTLEKKNICFLFAPLYHESLKKISELRKLLPFKTIFNLIGPLLNPTKLDFQLLGVSSKLNLETHALCLKRKVMKSSWVVHNLDGYDELTTTSPNLVYKINGKKVFKNITITPEEAGLKYSKQEDLIGGTPDENAYLMKRLFEGETGSIRDNVLFNTAACLVITKKVKNLREGVKFAAKNIDNYSAKAKLESLQSKD